MHGMKAKANTGAASAWRFLKRNPRYAEAWRATADRNYAAKEGPFPIRMQTEADLEAAEWGLLAWEDPHARDGPNSPFWKDAPMLEGEPGRKGMIPFATLVRNEGARLAGLRLMDGALILKVERAAASGQLRIENGDAFDLDGGLVLHLPYDLNLRMQLSRGHDLTTVAGPQAGRPPSPGRSRASCCSPSTESWQARALV